MTVKQLLAILVLAALIGSGCVTRTETVPYRPYAQPHNESVLEELRREFGWQSSRYEEPFHRRAARGVKETVSNWFSQEETAATDQEVGKSRRQFEQERQEALRRLRERQEQERRW